MVKDVVGVSASTLTHIDLQGFSSYEDPLKVEKVVEMLEALKSTRNLVSLNVSTNRTWQ